MQVRRLPSGNMSYIVRIRNVSGLPDRSRSYRSYRSYRSSVGGVKIWKIMLTLNPSPLTPATWEFARKFLGWRGWCAVNHVVEAGARRN